MEPELAFPVEKTLVEAGPAWVFRTRALKMTEYNTAEIRPTPAARFRFRFVQIELLVTSIVTVAVFPVIVLKYRPTAPRGILFGAMAALLLLDLAVFLIFTRVRGKPLPSEPIRIDLGRRIVFIPRLAIGSRLALAFGNGTSEPRGAAGQRRAAADLRRLAVELCTIQGLSTEPPLGQPRRRADPADDARRGEGTAGGRRVACQIPESAAT